MKETILDLHGSEYVKDLYPFPFLATTTTTINWKKEKEKNQFETFFPSKWE